MSLKGAQPVSEQFADANVSPTTMQWITSIARLANLLLRGKLNATTSLTLAASSTTTTLTNSQLGNSTVVLLMPTTANAKTAFLAGIYIAASTKLKGSCVLTHASNAATDQTFDVLMIG